MIFASRSRDEKRKENGVMKVLIFATMFIWLCIAIIGLFGEPKEK
jgi:hypothetical protein